MPRSLLEHLTDRQRICVLLRVDGWSYAEIGVFLGVPHRTVRGELQAVAKAFPGLLDHRRPANSGRLMRLVYLVGVGDGGGDIEECIDYLDALPVRSSWLRSRMRLAAPADRGGDQARRVARTVAKRGHRGASHGGLHPPVPFP